MNLSHAKFFIYEIQVLENGLKLNPNCSRKDQIENLISEFEVALQYMIYNVVEETIKKYNTKHNNII